jgi:hypothetical protein
MPYPQKTFPLKRAPDKAMDWVRLISETITEATWLRAVRFRAVVPKLKNKATERVAIIAVTTKTSTKVKPLSLLFIPRLN